MSHEYGALAEVTPQLSPEERAEIERINIEIFTIFDSIIDLYDCLDESDKNDLFSFLEQANTLAEKFRSVFDEVSAENFSPQSSVVAILRNAEKLQNQLEGVKADLKVKMKILGYDETTNLKKKAVIRSMPAPTVPAENLTIPKAAPVENSTEVEWDSGFDTLSAGYKMADPDVFLISDGQEPKKRKPFRTIRTELKYIFEAHKYGKYGNRFLSEIVDAVGKNISALNIQKKSEKKWEKREELSQLINGMYQDLLQDIAVFMQTVKVDIEDGVSPEGSLPEQGQQDTEVDIARANEMFKAVSEQLLVTDPLRQSPEFLAATKAVVALAEYHEADPVRAAADRQRMNKILQKCVNNLLVLVGQNQNSADSDVSADSAEAGALVAATPESVPSELVADFEPTVIQPEFETTTIQSEFETTVTQNEFETTVTQNEFEPTVIETEPAAEIVPEEEPVSETPQIDEFTEMIPETANDYLETIDVETVHVSDNIKELDEKFDYVKNLRIVTISEILSAAGISRPAEFAAVQSLIDQYENLSTLDEGKKLYTDKENCFSAIRAAVESLGRITIKRTSGEMESDWLITKWVGDDKSKVLAIKVTTIGGVYPTKTIPIGDLAKYNAAQTETVAAEADLVPENETTPLESAVAEVPPAEEPVSEIPEVPPVEELVSETPEAEVVSATEQASVVAELVPEDSFETKYHSNRTEWKEAKQAFREKETAYQAAMTEYFQADTWKAKLRSGLFSTKKILGLNPELPPALQALRTEYQAMRTVYAESLDSVLKSRSEADLENKEYETESDTTKAAFASKFILKPSREILALQERSVLSPEKQAQLARVMEVMAKHKWLTRVGIVTAAGVVGGLSGGLGLAAAGASIQAAKIALSAGAGAGAAYVTKKSLQGRVDTATSTLASAEANAKSAFSLQDLSELDDNFTEAVSAKATAERQQKVATVVAAVAAGGATGFTAGSFAQDQILSGADTGVETAAPVAAAEVPPAEPEVTPVAEVRGVVIDELTISPLSVDGRPTYENVLSDITFGAASHAEALSSVEQTELSAFVKLKAEDLLSAHPNMSEARLEAELFKSIQNKFSGATWWNDAKISQVAIGTFELRPLGTIEETLVAPAEVSTETLPSLVVEKGDTLSTIVEEQFSENLQGLSPNERTAVLDILFEKIQNDSELKSELGLSSGDVDLIYAGEKLNVAVLENELKYVLEQKAIIEQFTRSAPMAVTADAPVQTIPITVVEKPAPVSTAAILEKPTTSTEAVIKTGETAPVIKQPVEVVPAVTPETPLTAPRPLAVNGQYSEQPEYREYITKIFGSSKAFDQVIDRAVKNFDNGTYDIFERAPLLGGVTYESPYRLLSEMSLQDVKEFEAQSNTEIRQVLSQNNIKYDTYLAWLDQIDKMTKTLPNTPDTTVGDLFSRHVAEHDYLIKRK